MNTYSAFLGCLAIICYLQHGWAAPTQDENAESLIQAAAAVGVGEKDEGAANVFEAINKLRKEQYTSGSLEEVSKQSRSQRSAFSEWLAGLVQNLRNGYFINYACWLRYLEEDLNDQLDGYDRDNLDCSIRHRGNGSLPPLPRNIRRTYNRMDTPMCSDIAYFEAYRLRLQQLPFASDPDMQKYICYLKRIIRELKSLQRFREGDCPNFTPEQYLAIYRSHPNIYHDPENKHCVVYSLWHGALNRGGVDGRDVSTPIHIHCGANAVRSVCAS